jgi:hypothetical protein
MTREERETTIVANLGDLDQGFFIVETTERGVVRRLQRLACGRLEVEEHRSKLTGRPTGWTCRVPGDLWRGNILRVANRRPKSGGRPFPRTKTLAAMAAFGEKRDESDPKPVPL